MNVKSRIIPEVNGVAFETPNEAIETTRRVMLMTAKAKDTRAVIAALRAIPFKFPDSFSNGLNSRRRLGAFTQFEFCYKDITNFAMNKKLVLVKALKTIIYHYI